MRALVVGAGLMGRGIAIEVSKKAETVTLLDVDEGALRSAKRWIELSLRTLESYGLAEESMIDRIEFTTSMEQCRNADIVFEAVPEDVSLKGKVLGDIEGTVGETVPICTNTSVIKLSELARFLDRRSRFIGVHWMNPPYVMPLVEVVVTDVTDGDVVDFVRSFLEDVGKRVIVCRELSVVNRFNAAVLNEALRIMESDGISQKDIDVLWRYHLAVLYLLFGPFGNLDYIGLDTVLLAFRHLVSGEAEPPEWLAEKVRKGELGVKTGSGIYRYDGAPEEVYSMRVERILRLFEFLQKMEE